jgi:hypothetical protein
VPTVSVKKKEIIMLKKLALGAFALAPLSASAVVDVTTVTAGITDAETALVTVIGALMALSVALFGITMVYRFVKRKSGA